MLMTREPDTVCWIPENKFLTDQALQRKPAVGEATSRGSDGSDLGRIPKGLMAIRIRSLRPKDIRETFGRMAVDDGETVALVPGSAIGLARRMGRMIPANVSTLRTWCTPLEQQGLGWQNKCGKGNAEDTVSSGLEGAWTSNPVAF